MQPKVTVVTPTRNRLALLVETLASVSQQTLADWEHIVVDDGSDDGTVEAIASAAQGDPRIRYMQRQGEKSGANACRNQGLAAARGEFVVFLDSDDLLEPDCLRRRVEIMSSNADLDFAVFQLSPFLIKPGDLEYTTKRDIHGDDLLGFLVLELPWQTTAPIWRRTAVAALGGFDENLLSWQDIDLHIRALVASYRYLKFPDIDYHMRWQFEETKISVEQRRSPRHLEATGPLLEKFEGLVREGPGMTWVRQRALCNLYFFVAERWIDLGRTSDGLAFWHRVRQRKLAPPAMHAVGSLLLRLQSPRSPLRRLAARLCHKWKGWARLRINPELVAS